MCCKDFLQVHKNTGKNMFAKYISADDCFVKTMILNCDDNNDAIYFLILGRLLLRGSPWNEIWLEVLELLICIATRPFYLDLSFYLQKTEADPAYCPDRKEILQIIETIQKFSLFSTDGAIV